MKEGFFSRYDREMAANKEVNQELQKVSDRIAMGLGMRPVITCLEVEVAMENYKTISESQLWKDFGIADQYKIEADAFAVYRNLSGSEYIKFNPEKIGKLSDEKIAEVLKHEYIHSWVARKHYDSDIAGGHNEWFFWKAHQIGLHKDAEEMLEIYPFMRPVWEKIQRGWKPGKKNLYKYYWEHYTWEIILGTFLIVLSILLSIFKGF